MLLEIFERISKNARSLIGEKNYKLDITALVVDTESYKNTFTQEYTTAQTATAIITPTSGYRLCIRSVHIATDATAGEVQIDFTTSNIKVARQYVAKQARDWYVYGHIDGETDEPLTMTTTTGTDKVFVMITYIEHL